jgi:short-subunit dehydrogenase
MSNIVITGASQGIGEAIARAFARAGIPNTDPVRLSLIARNKRRLEKVAAECRMLGADVDVYTCDVTNEEAVRQSAEIIEVCAGAPDLLVNNAGSFEPGGILETDSALFKRQIDINLTSAFLVTSAFLPGMIARKEGHVIFLGSVASIKGYPGGVAYCASKHGLLGLARALREETRDRGIRVTTLLPGATRTQTWDGTSLPDSRFMKATDVAMAVLAAHEMSGRTVVEEMILRPQEGDI